MPLYSGVRTLSTNYYLSINAISQI